MPLMSSPFTNLSCPPVQHPFLAQPIPPFPAPPTHPPHPPIDVTVPLPMPLPILILAHSIAHLTPKSHRFLRLVLTRTILLHSICLIHSFFHSFLILHIVRSRCLVGEFSPVVRIFARISREFSVVRIFALRDELTPCIFSHSIL